MESLLQSFKFDDQKVQVGICCLTAPNAKRNGCERNEIWKKVQRLWWKGCEYERLGEKYQELLDKAFDALATNATFREALLATKEEVLTHSIGKSDPRETILTESEFCLRLTRIRSRLREIE
jgi:hypothetical protein